MKIQGGIFQRDLLSSLLFVLDATHSYTKEM